MVTRLFHCDGRLPNLALMRLSAYLKACGEQVSFVNGARSPELFDEPASRSFASSIFAFSAPSRQRIDKEWGPVVWGGTGVRVESNLSEVADVDWESIAPDYSLYPEERRSIGFTQRGCRLRCSFCVVPRKEGRPQAVHSIDEIWRGAPYPKKVLLLDNDFFGQPREEWQQRIAELRDGNFRVCFTQGINLRQVDGESAAAIASVQYRDNDFRTRVLYTAWDNLGDERVFKLAVGLLKSAGVPPKHLRVYMLVGFAQGETWEAILYRFRELVALGCEPYPMVYDQSRADLKAFQRWAVRGLYRAIPWEQYRDPRLSTALIEAK